MDLFRTTSIPPPDFSAYKLRDGRNLFHTAGRKKEKNCKDEVVVDAVDKKEVINESINWTQFVREATKK